MLKHKKYLFLLILLVAVVAIPISRVNAVATITVNSAADITANDGVCTLREAITSANTDTASGVAGGECAAGSGSDTIIFSITGTITPASQLPIISTTVTIDGTTQVGASCSARTLLVEINAVNETYGLNVSGNNFVLRGLAINRAGLQHGVRILNASNPTIECNNLGTDVTGTTAGIGNTQDGIALENVTGGTVGSTTLADRNIMSGNGQAGIELVGSTNGVNVIGNYIGTNFAGTGALGNTGRGVAIWGATGNTIGGTASGERNIISGNVGNGVEVDADNVLTSAAGNTIEGNYIGTQPNGTTALANTTNGIELLAGSGTTTIGGTTGVTVGGNCTGACNVIAGNTIDGIDINSSDSNTILGNYIGQDKTGATNLGNGDRGVQIGSSATSNTVGGTSTASRNVISGNVSDGVGVFDAGTTGNTILGNYIGTDVTGTLDRGNSANGVAIGTDASGNTVGGAVSGAGNVISGNNNNGINIASGTSSTTQGNYIGVSADGASDLGNSDDGIEIGNSSSNNTIGGDTSLERNIISGNGNDGVKIGTAGATGNVVQGNYIGLNSAGNSNLGNTANGIYTLDSAPAITVGGTNSGEGNVISGNGADGIHLDPASSGSTINGNIIGLSSSGLVDIGNAQNGVLLDGTPAVVIGGLSSAARNIISGNNENGISALNGATSITLQGNYIGTDVNGTTDLGNTNNGVSIASGSDGLTIGGIADGARNVISGNGELGIYTVSDSTTILGNYIGISANGQSAIGNTDGGIYSAGASTVVGGTISGSRNVISGNGDAGIALEGDSGLVQGNLVGTSSDGLSPLGNANYGITILGANGNNATIGGNTSSARNVVSATTNGGQNAAGIAIIGFGTANTGNKILGNYIGTNINGDVVTGLGNGAMGIVVLGSAVDNIIGGVNSGEGNKIAGNTTLGVFVYSLTQFGLETINNSILGNSITENGSSGIRLADSDGSSGFNPSTPEPYPNDPGDTDEITNHFMNFPEISAVTSTNGQVTITYNLDINDAEVGATGYRVEFFANDAADPSGHGEGQTYLGSDTISGDVTGRQATFTLPPGVSGNKFISSTTTMTDASTDGFGHTSEFSENVEAELVAATAEEETSTTDETLADTGQNTYLYSILSGALILGSAIVLRKRYSNR